MQKHKRHLALALNVMIKRKNISMKEGTPKTSSHAQGVARGMLKSRK